MLAGESWKKRSFFLQLCLPAQNVRPKGENTQIMATDSLETRSEESRIGLEELFSFGDLARMTRETVTTYQKRQARGEGPRALKIGRTFRFRKQDVLAWLESRAVGGSKCT
jgi:predicted DNA-binding transcriptional regulator AlpA